MQSTTFTFEADDRQPIFVYRWEPDAGVTPRALIHIVHGMAEHAARYARLAEALTARGYVVYAHDHRGHGRTARTASELGDFGARADWNRVVRDVSQLLDSERKAHPGLPVVLLGHSMGSFMCQQVTYEQSGRLAAVVFSGSNGKPNAIASLGRYVARAERLRLGALGKSVVLSTLSFGAFNRAFRPNRTEFDWLSRDNAEVDKYVADPLCGFATTAALWTQLLNALPALTRADNVARIRKDLPVLIIAGSEDPVSERTRGLEQLTKAYRGAGMTDVTARYYPGARHEIFNETNRDEVTAELLTWLETHVRPKG